MHDDGRDFWEHTAKRYDLSMRLLGGPLDAMLPMVTDEVRGMDRVLELAAGTGLVTAAMAPAVREVLATDYAEGMVAALDARMAMLRLDNVQTRQLDVYALVEHGVFDAVVAANVMHLLSDVDGAMATIRRALRPGGRLVAPTYCHDETVTSRLVSRVMALAGFPGRRRLTLDRLGALLRSHGFHVDKAVLLPGLLPIGFVSGRLVQSHQKLRELSAATLPREHDPESKSDGSRSRNTAVPKEPPRID